MNTTKIFFRYDINQSLNNLNGIYMDFVVGAEVYRVSIEDGSCRIPDEFLQQVGIRKVYECFSNNTIAEHEIKIKNRPMPPSYVFTPTQKETFDSLVLKVNLKLDEIPSDIERYIKDNQEELMAPIAQDLNEKLNNYYTKSEVDTKDNTKFDKDGGTVNGDVAITGNLTVNGTTVSESTKQLLVEDNIIVTNANKVDLSVNKSGIAINKNSNESYGLVYDPVDDTVKFGQGKYNDDKTFDFVSGEGLPIAIRDQSDNIQDGHLFKWDSNTKSLKDSGYSISDLKLFPPTEIKPKFADNSWETIAWVARYDDPSKYWKVGDYKNLVYPQVTRPGYISDSTSSKNLFFQTRNGTRPTPYSLGTITLKYPHKLATLINSADLSGYNVESGAFRIYTYLWKEDKIKYSFSFFAAGDTYPTKVIYETQTFEQLLYFMGAVINKTTYGETYLTEENLSTYGVHTSEGFKYKTKETYPAKQYPIMILGFNHDNVSNPYEYGKSKAGITFCLGITRAVTENSPPYDWDNAILPNLYESGTGQFDAANGDNTLMSPYWLGDGTNWQDTQFRIELQNLLNGTELENKIIPVEKITAAGLWQEGNNYFPKVFTDDKISLLSEYEIIGTPKFSNAQEGDQYEFFKRGNSRFYWNTAMVNAETQRLYLWLRSPINPKSFSSGVEKPLDYKGGCNLQCNSVEKAKISNTEVATIIDNTKAKNEIISLVEGYPEYRYQSIFIEYSIYDDGDGGMYHLRRIYYPTADDYNFASKDAIIDKLNEWGIALVDSDKDAWFSIYLSRDEQVGYSQGANSGNTKGSLLPIFCL